MLNKSSATPTLALTHSEKTAKNKIKWSKMVVAECAKVKLKSYKTLLMRTNANQNISFTSLNFTIIVKLS